MNKLVLILLCIIVPVIHGQANDTLSLNSYWSRLMFDSTTFLEATAIVGSGVSKPIESKYMTTGKGYPRAIVNYDLRQYIDSLVTEFVFTSIDTNRRDYRTLRKMEFYGGCKVRMNGNWQIDKSSKTQIKKKYGEPKYINEDVGLQLKWHTYALFVNNTLCNVDFYYDYSGILRKVSVESLKPLL